MTVHVVSLVGTWLFMSIPVSLLIGACIGATPDREPEIITPLAIPLDEAA
jgi:NhaP-type Na+/H+ or K+/H+ antiporter